MMNKTLLASAIALSPGAAASVQAATITITQMDFGNIYAATGTFNSAGTGLMNSIDPFFFNHWTATQEAWFDTHSSTLTWSGDGYDGAYTFSYSFHLTGNQVAVGTFFDWNASTATATLIIFDCPVSGGGACTGHSLPWTTGPFIGQQPGFNGVTSDDFPVSGSIPVPAAAWLMGSGLLGLIGFARRKKE